tara:strand:- start:192630 stop:192797 length:168 start_codon:yes stop_codon:yes gene_type:complete
MIMNLKISITYTDIIDLLKGLKAVYSAQENVANDDLLTYERKKKRCVARPKALEL